MSRRPSNAQLYVTADNYFRAFVNGQEVGSTKPEAGNDYVWADVHRFEVASLLHEGRNLIAIQGTNDGDIAGVLARLEIVGGPLVLSDRTWKVSEKEDSSWTSVDFNDASWPTATVIAKSTDGPWASRLTGWPVSLESIPSYLAHLAIPPVAYGIAKTAGHYDPLSWTPASDPILAQQPVTGQPWQLVIDFGRELPGRVRLEGESASNVVLGTGESDAEAIEKPWTSVSGTLNGLKPLFSPYTALRYASISLPADCSSVNLKATVEHLFYPVTYRGSFSSSDALLNQIWYVGAYTAHCCMQQDIWDAPKRDRARWMGDLHVSGEVINNVFLDRFLMEQTMSRLRAEAQGGKPATELPSSHVNDIPGYSCAWICGLADFYRHTGDLDYIRAQHDLIISMLQYFNAELDENGIFANKRGKWPFVDWSPGFNEDGPLARAATHLFLVRAVKEAAFLMQSMDDRAQADAYRKWAYELADAAQHHLVNNGVFSDRRQENAMAIYSGVATNEETQSIYKQVLDPNSTAWSEVATPYYDNYVIAAMSLAGHPQDALDFVRRFWGGMLKEGATTFWEGYDLSWPNENFHSHLQADNGTGYFVSLCHGWSAGATNFLTEDILGVKALTGGFATCKIAPQLCGLAWVSGEVPTPRGNIKVKVDGRQALLDIPQGTTAKFVWPSNIVSLDGKPIGQHSCEVSSGHHEIRFENR